MEKVGQQAAGGQNCPTAPFLCPFSASRPPSPPPPASNLPLPQLPHPGHSSQYSLHPLDFDGDLALEAGAADRGVVRVDQDDAVGGVAVGVGEHLVDVLARDAEAPPPYYCFSPDDRPAMSRRRRFRSGKRAWLAASGPR